MKNLLLAIATLLGKIAGKFSHMKNGCIWIHVRNPKGKFKKRFCNWCGKREDRLNGKWKYIGRYQRKIKG